MSRIKFLFLLAVLFTTSGYKFRCWWMCQDQTAIQNDYVEQRDRCRQYSQLKLDMAMRNSKREDNSQNRTAVLISLFSDCMASNGWSTTDVKPDALATGVVHTPPPAPPGGEPNALPADTTAAAVAAAEERAAISRKAECAFARQSASVSNIASARAKACDLECTQRLRQAPDAPRPAACPSGPVPGMETGADRTY